MDKLLFLIGGTAWINLVNTTYISNKQKIDILQNPTNTLRWLEENNLLRESDVLALADGELFDSLLVELHSLRDLSKMILSDIDQQGELSQESTDQLKTIVNQLKVSVSLVPKDEKISLTTEGITTIDHVLYTIVDSMIHTLDSVSNNRIRKCEHEECTLHFVDTSKSGKRRWCSMELCGNRKKVAEFYARKKNK
ncbi:CGNR zinc finger domain-containing protein [Alkalicoccobacillus porphyridii]|uniref:CGNR zinc finger domain-containing protein n=1 Tax=Alkalicoccobacillus porphyridii TaxID=2597270 RepID=A0A554A254_9BACI|nr:CGNR zinc finger domain-containing protein [Alkalicoccobacillus porphyridii]TSB47768.1 CGNR zinc finger domain-containing protein [Alkalicoccobacillus porphyridii]